MYVTEWKQISKVIEQMELLSCEKKYTRCWDFPFRHQNVLKPFNFLGQKLTIF